MLGVFLLAGLRLSEQMALTRGQLRFDENLIHLDRAVKLDRTGKQSVGLPKGDKTRHVVMCPTLKTTVAIDHPRAASQPSDLACGDCATSHGRRSWSMRHGV